MNATLRPRERTRSWPVLVALLASVLLLVAVLLRITVRTDMTAFLPEGETQAARIVLSEAREGTATGLVLLGIEGADVPELARISRDMATRLTASRLFTLVAGGEAALPREAIEGLFARRYLLVPVDWSEPALRADLERLLRQMRGSEAGLAQLGLRDPPEAALTALRNWGGASAVRSLDGAWFAADRDRALLLLRTRAGGMDVPGQEAASAAIEGAFQQAQPGPARLLEAGPAVFARDAARSIRWDVRRLSVLSTLLVAALLVWRFRSPLVIAAIAAPVVASVAAAAAVVQLLFGSVHGVALGFGATMLGISVDYPVLMIGHRKRGEPAPATRARIGRAFVLAVATAALGLAAMTFSGFPGLVQLGAFSAVGLLSCAVLTWFGLPPLIVAANLAPVAAGDPAWLHRVERWRRWRWLVAVPIAAALAYLLAMGGPRWEGDLQNLSPVPEASRALDRTLRQEIGAPDVGQFLLVRGPDPQSVLEKQETLLPTLDRLVADGTIGGYEAAARLIPSAARQEMLRKAVPSRAEVAARLEPARAELPFRPEAFDPFLDAVARTHDLPTLRPEEVLGTPLGTRLEPLLLQRAGEWRGPMVLTDIHDPAKLAQALGALPAGVLLVDMRTELGGILAGYMARAWGWLAWSGVAVLIVLLIGIRRPAMVLRVLGAVAAAGLVTAAVLTAFGIALSLIHLVALQLVAGVGLDYALFFARRQLDGEERARTLRTLVTCNAMTLLTFGLLAFCSTPVLRDIGVTVACGAVLAMGFAFLMTGEAPA